MLSAIYLKNFTVIKELELNLHRGLSVLSGETGAGKSIIVDAVSLCLGARADTSIIRHLEPQCELTLCFNIENVPAAQEWLHQNACPLAENDCIISRIIQRDGRSRSTVNGKPCSLNAIRELANYLLAIHGQHHSQTLLQRVTQQQYVDGYGQHEALLHDIRFIYEAWRDHAQKKSQLETLSQEREQQLDFLRYQINEFHALEWKENEWPAIQDEYQKLHRTKEDIVSLEKTMQVTQETELKVHKAIQVVISIDPHHNVVELLQSAAVHLEEARIIVQNNLESLEVNDERLAYLSERITRLHDIARKHRTTVETLPQVVQALEEKIGQLESSDTQLQHIEKEQTILLRRYAEKASQLSSSRTRVAEKISTYMTEALQGLGMQGGIFNIIAEPIQEPIGPEGNETLHFYVQTNPGQAMQPLAKIVSGGELSRISLALQTLIHQLNPIPTLIFDEVDTGIGGQTAEIVGKLLHDLGQKTQVYCITHLPQVAAQGDHHYRITKVTSAKSTYAEITELNHEERITELARMISGSKITKETLAHAETLLQ